MSEISSEVIDKMMVKCGRRCCICKRYRPTKLQVHHIHEKAKGGSDDEDNLIVTCFSCHSDVHTHVPFARRFSETELKLHRDTLVKQVADGVFTGADTDDTDEVIRAVIQEIRSTVKAQVLLLPEASEMLLKAAKDTSQGWIIIVRSTGGIGFYVGGSNVLSNPHDMRLVAKYKHALKQLVACGLLESSSSDSYELTYAGYLLADEITVEGPKTFVEQNC